MKRVSFWKVPDGEGNSSFWLHHPQHFPNAINRRWKEHDTEPAHYRVKVVGGKRQTIGKGNSKPSIPQLAALRCTSGADIISGTGSRPTTLPLGPTTSAMLSAGSPGPVA